ncbi:hypothetical protein ACIPLR_25630 [Herbaspirillum huttiense]|uniref:hypothetical protein n=1 Tax=Herbaspirillum huttiense TaxID=863372 RepID=UPI00382B7691
MSGGNSPRDLLIAELLGDVGKLDDKIKDLQAAIPGITAEIQEATKRLNSGIKTLEQAVPGITKEIRLATQQEHRQESSISVIVTVIVAALFSSFVTLGGLLAYQHYFAPAGMNTEQAMLINRMETIRKVWSRLDPATQLRINQYIEEENRKK